MRLEHLDNFSEDTQLKMLKSGLKTCLNLKTYLFQANLQAFSNYLQQLSWNGAFTTYITIKILWIQKTTVWGRNNSDFDNHG